MRVEETEKQAAPVRAAAFRMARCASLFFASQVALWIKRPRAHSVNHPGLSRRATSTNASMASGLA